MLEMMGIMVYRFNRDGLMFKRIRTILMLRRDNDVQLLR